MSAAERLFERVKKGAGPGGTCWEWQGAIDSSGHGTMKDGEKQVATHVVAFESKHGAVPAGKMVCHKCHNKKCVNPAHLYAGSASDNAKDREAAKQTTPSLLIRNASEGFALSPPIPGEGGKWSQLFPWGKRYRADYPGGSINYDASFFATIRENWEASGKQPLPIDYFHRGDSRDGDGNTVDDKVAAGWIHELEVRQGQGVWALIEWTPKGAEKVKAGELRYLSPTFQLNWLNPKTGKKSGPRLCAAGLLNDPFFTEMPRVAASAVPPPPKPPKERTMEKKLVCAALGMPEDTADDVLLEMMGKGTGALKQAAQTAAVTSAAQKDFETLKQSHEALKKQNGELVTTVETLINTKKQADVEAVLETHKAHFVPASRDAMRKLVNTLGLEEGAKVLAAMPVTAPPVGTVGHSQPGNTDDKVTNTASLETIAAEIQKTSGVTSSVALELAMRRNPSLAIKSY